MPNDTIHVSNSTCRTALNIIRRLRSIFKIRKTYDKEVCIPLDQAALQSECTDPGAPLSYNYKQPVHACCSSPAALCVLYSARAAALQSSQHCHLLALSCCKPMTCCRHHYTCMFVLAAVLLAVQNVSASHSLQCFAGMLDRKVGDYSHTCDAYVDMLGTDKGCCSQEQAMTHMQPVKCASYCHTLKAQGLFADILIHWHLRQLGLLLQLCAQYPNSRRHPKEILRGKAAQLQESRRLRCQFDTY